MSFSNPPPPSIYFRQTCTFITPEQQAWDLHYNKLCKEGITEETKSRYQSLNKQVKPLKLRGIAVDDGTGAGYSHKVRRFVSDEFCHQAAFQQQLGKSVDLDFVIAEAYRCHPDYEEAHMKSGEKALQMGKWKKMLAFV
ncbi:hypothetical protein E2P81_ATG10861 [Venturia nashicola]|nr:hypothetical protein E2P81_ATG10861 [Venturia nashicola]